MLVQYVYKIFHFPVSELLKYTFGSDIREDHIVTEWIFKEESRLTHLAYEYLKMLKSYMNYGLSSKTSLIQSAEKLISSEKGNQRGPFDEHFLSVGKSYVIFYPRQTINDRNEKRHAFELVKRFGRTKDNSRTQFIVCIERGLSNVIVVVKITESRGSPLFLNASQAQNQTISTENASEMKLEEGTRYFVHRDILYCEDYHLTSPLFRVAGFEDVASFRFEPPVR